VHAGLVQRNAALASRVARLAETRVAAVDNAAAELRRVERDLHDGAQARLIALGINLRAAEQLFTSNPDAALALVTESRENSALALAELRALVRASTRRCSPSLGRRRALALAHRCHGRQTSSCLVGLRHRRNSRLLAVAEAVANASKHADASHVHILIDHRAGMLRIEVTDDGRGGADPAHGTGLVGVERRMSTFDGIFAVSSPPGGPTIIVIEVPCALSSPKTFFS
jgi:signal transduction histidine kinase